MVSPMAQPPAGYPQAHAQHGQPAPGAMVHQGSSGIELEAGFMFLQWLLFLVSPVAVVNGHKHTAKWGHHFIPLPPGQYEVTVYFPWLLTDGGKATRQVVVYDNSATGLKYDAPFFVIMSGSLVERGVRPLTG